ncbi:MAG: hypothetical protein R3E42_11875 [Burkholderiaceae bacterium]
MVAASLADAKSVLANAADRGRFDLVLLDLGLPDGDGEALLGSLRADQRPPA